MANSSESGRAREADAGPTAQLVGNWSTFLPDLDATAFSIQLHIQQINLLAIRETNRIAEKYKINSVDMSLLMAIRRDSRSRPVRPSDLWRLFDLAPSAITYRMDRLFDLGYVVRLPHPDDRRALYLKLTAKGETAVSSVVREFNAVAVEKLAEVDKIGGGRVKLDKLLTALLRKWRETEPAAVAAAAAGGAKNEETGRRVVRKKRA
ncbi:MAG TPA: MarR family transcriptional regulator [Steroidobacteraceae bacterium]|nr:MarR family transcriptional regulator [Steroidobacteraceae bacterium]